MMKSIVLLSLMLTYTVTFNHAIFIKRSTPSSSSSSTVTFLKPKANIMRRLNPLKLLFTVACIPERQPSCAIEWNLAVLKTIVLESSLVSEEDKIIFLSEFGNYLDDYADWSPEKHNKLERFTENYFNLYKSPEHFLPFNDCPTLTYALTDEMINDLHNNVDDEKRAEIRARIAARLCDAE